MTDRNPDQISNCQNAVLTTRSHAKENLVSTLVFASPVLCTPLRLPPRASDTMYSPALESICTYLKPG